MSDEWGPWIEHDGRECPVRGQFVQSVERSGRTEVHIAESICFNIFGERCSFRASDPSAWVWADVPPLMQIVRYRIRKPRGLTILEQIAADPPKAPIRKPQRVPA